MKDRDPVFDVMKGIGIILMLVGHIPPGEKAYCIIYSFHMPLFFLVAGAFAKVGSDSEGAAVKDLKRLVLPVFITMVFIFALSPLYYFIDGDFNNTVSQVLSLLWLGDAVGTNWGLVTIDSMWFLMALFWARCLFRVVVRCCEKIQKLRDEIIVVVCVALSFVAISLRPILPPIPWGLLKGLSAIQFYAIGWYLKHHKLPGWVYSVLVVCWLLALRFGGIDMVRYYYGCYPLDVLGAVGATMLVYLFSKAICTYLDRPRKLFQWFGVNSLLILCVNTLDRKTCLVRAIKNVLSIGLTGIYSVMFHYAIEMVLVVVIVYFTVFKKIYGTKRWKEI